MRFGSVSLLELAAALAATSSSLRLSSAASLAALASASALSAAALFSASFFVSAEAFALAAALAAASSNSRVSAAASALVHLALASASAWLFFCPYEARVCWCLFNASPVLARRMASASVRRRPRSAWVSAVASAATSSSASTSSSVKATRCTSRRPAYADARMASTPIRRTSNSARRPRKTPADRSEKAMDSIGPLAPPNSMLLVYACASSASPSLMSLPWS